MWEEQKNGKGVLTENLGQVVDYSELRFFKWVWNSMITVNLQCLEALL